MIRSQVEYACPIWSPTDSANINKLEDVQRHFTSKFQRFREYDEELGMTICVTPYPERLKALKLQSLQRRRERYLILYMAKIKLGLVPNPGFEPEYHVRCQKFRYKPKYDRKNGRHSFFCIGPRLFNSIPPGLREFDDAITPDTSDLDAFKKMLDEYLLTVSDDPTSPQSNSLLHDSKKYISNGQSRWDQGGVKSAGLPQDPSTRSKKRATAADRWKSAKPQSRWDVDYSGM